MQLYLIRHPKPAIAAGICYGRTDLTVEPVEVAAALARCQPQLPPGLPFYVSPLVRCQGLARGLFAACHGSGWHDEPRLQELDFGAWEMQPWEAIARSQIDAWASDRIGYRPGGAENVLDLVRRVLEFLGQLQHARIAKAVLVCHAGPIRVLQAWQQAGIELPQIGQIGQIGQAGLLHELADRASLGQTQIEYGQVLHLALQNTE